MGKRDKYQQERIDQGLCYRCGKPRGTTGTTTMCRPCADKHNKYHSMRRRKRDEEGCCRECGKKVPKVNKYLCEDCAVRHIRSNWLLQLKRRAENKNLPFDLIIEDLEVPEYCPVLGIPLQHSLGKAGTTDNSPTVDRLIPEKGYVKSNTHIISYKANAMKRDATLDEIRKLLSWMEGCYGISQL